ncbi:hypothetical protein [Streptomyces sp. NPDC006333]|uniref:hypothetical protein n=1 Tax=Streptomyces sp. NPDC006333 TaxID=3156753 RepID=UPI00339F5360
MRPRPVPEWGCLLVYTPSRPGVHYLDPRSWLMYELCDGRTYEEITAEYSEAVPEGTAPETVSELVNKGLEALLLKGIIEKKPALA